MIVYLEASTWIDHDPTAKHWYGELKCGRRTVELQHEMSAAEALYENQNHRNARARPGDITGKYLNLQDLVDQSVNTFQNIFPGARLLVEGRNSLYPGPVLFGPPEVQQQARVLHDRMEAQYAGRSEPRSWAEHDAILAEWEALIAPYKAQP